jgi:hypothetical protein
VAETRGGGERETERVPVNVVGGQAVHAHSTYTIMHRSYCTHPGEVDRRSWLQERPGEIPERHDAQSECECLREWEWEGESGSGRVREWEVGKKHNVAHTARTHAAHFREHCQEPQECQECFRPRAQEELLVIVIVNTFTISKIQFAIIGIFSFYIKSP